MENMPTNFRVRMIRPETKIMRKSKSEPISLSLPALNIGSGRKTSEMSGVIGFFQNGSFSPHI